MYIGASTDLIFNDNISEILCKVAYSADVPVVPRIITDGRTFRQGLQLVLDTLEGSDVVSA